MGSEIINKLPEKTHMWGSAARSCMPLANKSQIIDHGTTRKTLKRKDGQLKTCKFYFAFENSNCSDYITEKFSNALANYAIPIVNGWRESYEQRLPGSFIHVADFETTDHLVEYLKTLLQDENKLLELHKWRQKFELIRENKISMHNRLPCRVCEKVAEIRKKNKGGGEMRYSETIPDLGKAFQGFQTCVTQ